jgi:hypothetical protein
VIVDVPIGARDLAVDRRTHVSNHRRDESRRSNRGRRFAGKFGFGERR